MTIPSTLDPGPIGELAVYLDRHASGYRDHASRIADGRAAIVQWWIGDAADSFARHAKGRVEALEAMGEVTAAAAVAARRYASAIASALPKANEAEQRANAAWEAGEYLDYAQWRWQYQRIDFSLASAAAEFANALNDRFVGNPGWLELFDDDDDLDSLADERDESIDEYDEFLADQTRSAEASGLVDGTPDRIPPPPGPSNAGKLSETKWESLRGLEIPYRALEFTIGGKRAGTVHELADGTYVVEIEDAAVLGIEIGANGSNAGIEGSFGVGQRYHLPDKATLDEFRARLEARNDATDIQALTSSNRFSPNVNNEWDEIAQHHARQFDALYDRYQVGDVTKYGAGPTIDFDSPVADFEGQFQVQRSIDWTTGEVSSIHHYEGDLRGTTQVFTGGGEVEADLRRVTKDGNLTRVEFEVTGYGEGGLNAELDAFRREGLGDLLDDNRYLRHVEFRTDATGGVWGRYNMAIPADTPENAALAERMAKLVERGQFSSAIDVVRSSSSGSTKFEFGGFVGRETDVSAIVKYESQDRHHDVWFQSPDLPPRR